MVRMRISIELYPPHWLRSPSPRRRALMALALVLVLALWPLAALASDIFADVPGTMPQHDAINRVYAAGIMRACTATVPPNFCPNDPVLRFQQASQWDRALGLNGTATPGTYVSRAAEADYGLGEVQVGNAAPTGYQYSLRRFVVEARPASVGVVVAIPVAITDAYCKDIDGCRVSASMVNWDAPGHPGLAATRELRLFISETSEWWRFADIDVDGTDNNGVLNEWSVYDCVFTDAELSTNSSNGRADAARGFGLLNILGGSYSDVTVTCRVVIED